MAATLGRSAFSLKHGETVSILRLRWISLVLRIEEKRDKPRL
jgi:hypothetical protein